jgi:hypothetical protein
LGKSRLGVKRFLDELEDGSEDEEEEGREGSLKAAKRSKEKGPGGGVRTGTSNNRRKEAARLKKAVKKIVDTWRENDDGDEVEVDTRALLL